MSVSLKITFADHFKDSTAFYAEALAPFSPTAETHLNLDVVGWDKLWDFLQAVSAGKAQASISEVGSTWTGHLIESGSICELSERDIARIGGEDRFFPSAWESTSLLGDDRVFAVPWLADTRVVYYWRSKLQRAGIDERTAFITPANMNESLEALQNAGIPAWGAPTFEVNNTLHQISSWIWSNGGDFLSDDGKQTAFLAPPAFSGICDYFRLYRCMPRDFDDLDSILDAFEDRRLAVIVNGSWYLMRMILGGATDADLADLGVALPPGPPFVGGSNLVFWHPMNAETLENALALVNYLLSLPVRRRICAKTGLLPVSAGLLNEAPYADDTHYQVFKEALKLGRPLPMIAFWGPLEAALLKGFGAIWADLKVCRDCHSIESIVRKYLEPIGKRFDRILRLV